MTSETRPSRSLLAEALAGQHPDREQCFLGAVAVLVNVVIEVLLKRGMGKLRSTRIVARDENTYQGESK